MARAEHVTIRVQKSYSKRMSDHVAFALVIYTLLLIFAVTPAIESKGTSILPYFMLVIFVGLVIPACRGLERRWQALQATDNGDGSLDTRYKVDRAKLWLAAIGIPVGLALFFHAISAAT